ncbi:MAG: hypothetical protein QF405_15570 [Roseibacillus sp.]|nr:hypothetical protein [Roseibacillus sp.]MDP7309061.1 hypothetical protein [Roseibacillus sp.]MDP7495267.1 hypothetical protein [Roseibacillus sp.]MDP7656333.1 hypothetical protein [Roseibacillus sp.]HJM63661.1 hypothetical protein [Roseibacillus sp.]
MSELITLFVAGLSLLGCLLLGSILAVRHGKNWATLALLMGTICMLVSFVAMISLRWAALGLSASPSGYAQEISRGLILGSVLALLFLAGTIAFCAGFVGMCAKYGITARRAQELEGLLQQLQQRMPSGG